MHRHQYRSTSVWTGMALVLITAASGWASSGTTFDGAVTPFTALFTAAAYVLGFAGLATVVYSVAMNRHGMHWDQGVSIVAASALAFSAPTILGWVGGAQGATLPPQSHYEFVVVPAEAAWPVPYQEAE